VVKDIAFSNINRMFGDHIDYQVSKYGKRDDNEGIVLQSV
jgi:hypothetical protein